MKLAVYGLGKLGSPMAAIFASQGHEVLGVDVNQDYVDAINSGKAPVQETNLPGMIWMAKERLAATTDPVKAAAWAEMLFIVVPTPSEASGTFSNRYIRQVLVRIEPYVALKTVVIVSTVMPGSCDELADLVPPSTPLVYNPEFIALGSVLENINHPDLVLIGEGRRADADQLVGFWEDFYLPGGRACPPIHRMTWHNAEAAKLLLNCYLTMKLSYTHLVSEIAERIPCGDAKLILDAIGCDSRIGGKFFQPGAAWGGPCFPRDAQALSNFAWDLLGSGNLLDEIQTLNDRRVDELVDWIRKKKPQKVAILGLAYKAGVPIAEASFGVRVAEELIARTKGHLVINIYDPEVPVDDPSIPLSIPMRDLDDCLDGADTVVIATPCPEVAELEPENFSDGATIVDYWRMLPEEKFKATQKIVIPGRFQGLSV